MSTPSTPPSNSDGSTPVVALSDTPIPRSTATPSTEERTPSKRKREGSSRSNSNKRARLAEHLPKSPECSPSRSFTNSPQESIDVKLPQPDKVKLNLQGKQLLKVPRILKVYMNGPPGRLYSIRDTKRRRLIYHHLRDLREPFEMTIVEGKVQKLKNSDTREVLYQSPSYIPSSSSGS